VQTAAPIGWARASASVLIFQRACSARTPAEAGCFRVFVDKLAVAFTETSASCEVLAQSNHFEPNAHHNVPLAAVRAGAPG